MYGNIPHYFIGGRFEKFWAKYNTNPGAYISYHAFNKGIGCKL